MRRLLLVLMLATFLSVQFVHSQSIKPQAGNGTTGPQFVMGPSFALIPENFFMLVRKGREIGAIRLTDVKQDAKGLGTSTYESYFQGDGSGAFQNAHVVKRTGEIEIKTMRGFHPLAWQPGQNKLWVGKWWFGCLTPSLINMSSHFSEKDKGYEFAPTSARSVREIDASDNRLKWFRFDPNARIVVPVSDLPK